MKYWSKFVLAVYKYLPTMTNAIDKVVLDIGKNSNSLTISPYHNTFFQAGKIIDLID